MYSARTYDEILNELKEIYQSATGFNPVEGQFSFDVLSSNAVEFAKMEVEIAEAYRNAFAQSASVEYLEMRCNEQGLYRKPGKKAVGKLKVTGSGNIYQGSVFCTEKNTRFIAVADSEIDGEGVIDIEAEILGDAGNVAAGTIIKLPMSIPGIRACINENATFDGYDEETDDELRERFLIFKRYPSQTGNPNFYVNTALAVEGVGLARCQRTPFGAGTVRLVIADENLQAANVLLLERVFEAIEAARPVGAEVSIISAEIVPVNISCEIVGTLNEANFVNSVIDYFKNLSLSKFTFDSADIIQVSAAKISSLFIDNGAEDVTNFALNGENSNIRLNPLQIASLGNLTFK